LNSYFHTDFKIQFSNKKVGKEKLGEWWITNNERRQYEEMVFNPDANCRTVESGIYNRFSGLTVTPTPGNWSLMQEFIFETLCHGNDANYQYYLSWLAQAYTHPEAKPGVCIALLGGKGTGKTVATEIFGAPFGLKRHHLDFTGWESALGRFNGESEDAIFISVQEAKWKGGNNTADATIRGLITDPTRKIEGKGIERYTIDNYLRFMITSEDSSAVPAGRNERRFFTLDLATEWQQNKIYFSALRKQMEKDGGIAAMVYDLQQRAYTDEYIYSAPETTALTEQQQLNLKPEERWLQEYFQASAGFQRTISKAALWDNYRQFDPKANQMSNQDFGHWLIKKVFRGSFLFSANSRIGSEKQTAYKFPGLEECRRVFDEFVSFKTEWDGTAEEGENRPVVLYKPASLPFKAKPGLSAKKTGATS
jgi:hypothetical protein